MSSGGSPNSQLALPGIPSEPDVEWVWAEESEESMEELPFVHATVMKDEVVNALGIRPGGVYVDATLGGGGHTEEILSRDPSVKVIGFDRDGVALSAATARLARFGERITMIRAPFSRMKAELEARGIADVDGVIADLGVSSPQLDDASRGMSFRREGPIDMRMDRDGGETALEMIARMSDDELADVIYRYGEERKSRRIARSIRRAYEGNELQTTLDLRRAIVRAIGPVRVGGVDPATRTFQALRIAVNDELGELEALLTNVGEILRPGGIACLLSFHSLEDRIVKQTFHREMWSPLTKKPMIATEQETVDNPRARSAKLRAAVYGSEP